MKLPTFIFIPLFCFMFGIFLYGFYQEWVIIRLPWQSNNQLLYTTPTTSKHVIAVWWMKNKQWKYESEQILWSNSIPDTVFHLVQSWLALMKEEQIINPMVTLQSIAITAADHAYISFDQNILPKESSVYEKWIVIESLLKTIRENKLPVQSIVLLTNHQISHDRHLDFSCPWPIQGFLTQ